MFTKVLELLIEAGYVKLENYFVDESKVGANANAHKVVWAKKTKRYKEKLREQIKVLLDEIEQVNEQENQEYGKADLEEMGGQGGMSSGKLQKKVDELNEALQKAVKKMEKQHLPRLKKYEEQEKILAGRNSYSRTDPDASNLRMKEDRAAQKPLAHAAYTVQIGTENQFIVGYSVHQPADDSTCFISHMEQQTFPNGLKPNNGSGDAGYGSEENYAWLEKNDIQNFFRYHTFHKEQHPPRKPEFIAQARFQSANFPYDPVKDEFTCPAQAKVHPG